jgi:hypothetical protein
MERAAGGILLRAASSGTAAVVVMIAVAAVAIAAMIVADPAVRAVVERGRIARDHRLVAENVEESVSWTFSDIGEQNIDISIVPHSHKTPVNGRFFTFRTLLMCCKSL